MVSITYSDPTPQAEKCDLLEMTSYVCLELGLQTDSESAAKLAQTHGPASWAKGLIGLGHLDRMRYSDALHVCHDVLSSEIPESIAFQFALYVLACTHMSQLQIVDATSCLQVIIHLLPPFL